MAIDRPLLHEFVYLSAKKIKTAAATTTCNSTYINYALCGEVLSFVYPKFTANQCH